jgi:hypothetical protein
MAATTTTKRKPATARGKRKATTGTARRKPATKRR